jgi:dolichol kinase
MHQKDKFNKYIKEKLYENHIERWWYLNFSVLFYILYYIVDSKYWLYASIGSLFLFLLTYIFDIILIKKKRLKKNE